MGGFGHKNVIRTVDAFQFSLDLPVIIDVVDSREKIMALLPEIESLIDDGDDHAAGSAADTEGSTGINIS